MDIYKSKENRSSLIRSILIAAREVTLGNGILLLKYELCFFESYINKDQGFEKKSSRISNYN